MTAQRAAELLPIIKAFSEGATIQYLHPERVQWVDVVNNEPSWTPKDTYRIKPEPKEFWIVHYRHKQYFSFCNKEDAQKLADSENACGRGCELIHVREVE